MKQIHRLILGIVLLCTVMLTLAGVASAASANQEVSGITNRSVYRAADTAMITGQVNGDIYCVGQTVTISGTVNGDVLCAAQTINISGTVNGSVRLVGQSINVSANITHGASLVGQDIMVADSARIGQDAGIVGQTVLVDGRISRDLSAVGNAISLNGIIGRNVSLHVTQLTLGASTLIGGNLDYTSAQQLSKNNGAKVVGTVSYHKYQPHNEPVSAGFMLLAKLFWLVSLTILSVVLVALFPRLFKQLNPIWGSQFWWLLLTGFLAMFVVPVIILVLVLTVVGIPLGLLLLLLWIIAAIVSVPLASYFTGSLLVPKLHPVLMVLIGGVTIGIIEFIPILGWVIGLIAYWLGIGILLAGLKRSYASVSSSRTEKLEGRS